MTSVKTVLRALLAALVSAGLGACGQADDPAPPVSGPAPEEASLRGAIHQLETDTSKRYVEVNPVGEFPLRPPPVHGQIRLEKSVLVPMRDGVRLSTDIYSPVGVEGPLPVVLIRLPYNKNTYLNMRKPGDRQALFQSDAYYFAGHGYRVVVQDMRGRHESEGEYRVSASNRNDGYDMLEWLSNQPWTNGRIGTYGCSYLGENQIQQAAERHPNHTAAIPQAAGGGYIGTGRPFGARDGGVPELATGLGWFWAVGANAYWRRPPGLGDEEFRTYAEQYESWPKPPELDFREAFGHLPVIDIFDRYGGARTDFEDFFSKSLADPYWDSIRYADRDDRFDVPALHVNSWYDGVVNETLELFNLFRTNAQSARARDNQFAIVSPTRHCASEFEPGWEDAVVGEMPVGDISKDYFRIYLDWFDHWLKGVDNGVTDMPKLQYYAMGAKQWRNADGWPLPGTEFRKYYLTSEGDAADPQGTGELVTETPTAVSSSDRFTYDPADPAPSVGGPICCISREAAPAGAYDQSEVGRRPDVLVYRTGPLEEDLEITGPLTATLYVSSSAKDTDFTVKLIDMHPDGKRYNIQEGILRARFREGFEREVFMEPGGIYRLDIDLHATGNVFLEGHRIGLHVSSSNFPRFVRNLNTGGRNFDESEWVVAENSVHHSRNHPSHLTLPVVPDSR